MHIIFLIALLLFPLIFQFPFFFPFSGVPLRLPVHVIQQGLLNPSPDISEMLSEATTTEHGTSSYVMSVPQFATKIPNLILFNTLSSFLGYCIYFYT